MFPVAFLSPSRQLYGYNKLFPEFLKIISTRIILRIAQSGIVHTSLRMLIRVVPYFILLPALSFPISLFIIIQYNINTVVGK
jgi:hypothetical protein